MAEFPLCFGPWTGPYNGSLRSPILAFMIVPANSSIMGVNSERDGRD